MLPLLAALADSYTSRAPCQQSLVCVRSWRWESRPAKEEHHDFFGIGGIPAISFVETWLTFCVRWWTQPAAQPR